MSDPPQVALRPGGPGDAVEIARMHCAAALAGYARIFPPEGTKPTPDSLTPGWKQLLDDPTVAVAVATTADSVVGAIVLVASTEVPTGLVLKRLYVEPRLWGHGVGSLLHDWAIDRAGARGAQRLNLWVLEANTRARRMYERRGWRHIPGPTLPNDDPTIVDVLYERAIP